MTVEYVRTDENNLEFRLFLERLKETNASYEVVVEDNNITKVYARFVDTGNWKHVQFGRLIGSKMLSYIEVVYKPRVVDGKFIYNFNEKNKRFK